MSHSNTVPVDAPAPPHSMAGAKPSRSVRQASRLVLRGRRDPAHDAPQTGTPSMDEGAIRRKQSAERTSPHSRELDPSEDPAAWPRTPSAERSPTSQGFRLPVPGKLFTPPTPSDGSSAKATASSSEELIPAYDIPAPDVAIPKPTLGQSRPPDTEPAGPVDASHRDLTITDSTPCGKEQRFSFSFTFPPHPGFAPPSPAVPQQPCAGCAEGRRHIEEQLQQIRWNQEVVARQLTELEQRDARRQLREAEEQRRAESLQETRKREDTQLASLLEAMRVVAVRLVEVATDSRRHEDEHREQSERREAALR